MENNKKVKILYASETGTAMELAEEL